MWFPIILISIYASSVLAIWPVPVSFTNGTSVLWIKNDVQVSYNGASVWWTPPFVDVFGTEKVLGEQLQNSTSYTSGNGSIFTSQSIIRNAYIEAMKAIIENSIIPWKLVPRNELSNFEPSCDAPKSFISEIAITQTGTDTANTFKPLAGDVDESYNLTVTEDGKVAISAVSSTGVLHGLQTFTQLFYQHSSGNGTYTNLAPVAIVDAPKFAHRGLNMDVSRNWYPVDDILRTIYALSINKFNRIHIHMTDAQSWPIEIPALPELAQKGAYQTGLSYSPQDIANIQAYAISVGVEVIIEFDMPGHTTAIGLAYPDLITAYNAQPWDTYCAEPPCGSLRLNDSAVDSFLDTLFADILPRVQPYSAYFHTGGDEVNVNAYLLDPTVKSNDTAVLTPLLQKFLDRNHDQIRAAGLTPIVWEEMITTWNLTLGNDVLVQTWLSDASVATVTAAGHKALAGNYEFWVC